jgi:DNA repair ATPase RecN
VFIGIQQLPGVQYPSLIIAVACQDQFESRINIFREAILVQYNELMDDDVSNGSSKSNIDKILQNLRKNTWEDAEVSEDASLFANLLGFREEIKAVETKLASAHTAHAMLSSMSSPDSASVVLDKVRKILYGMSRDDNGPLFDSIEKTHELLNEVEEALNDCARSIDGGSKSVISTLEKMVCKGVSLEQIDTIIADWNSLARKHGISPYTLPKCHESLRQELDGNAEALMLLPAAERDERQALKQYSANCKELSDARLAVADSLSQSVTELLPSLGLDGTMFQVKMSLRSGGFDNPYCRSESLGVDIADFLLLHQKSSNNSVSETGGNIDQVGSSGEKSRVLLAIETCLPGSIGTTCNAGSENLQYNVAKAIPLAIVYDEIDAHVGGRAAVTMARLLADQTKGQSRTGTQIIAITHSASVAAIADQHIVVERSPVPSAGGSSKVRVYSVDGSERSKEIARMASGDLASGEAQAFANALIRDAKQAGVS